MVYGNGGGSTEPRKNHLEGYSGTLATPKAAKGGQPDGGRDSRNRLAERGC